MRVTTVLNTVEKLKGFVFEGERWAEDEMGEKIIEVTVRSDKRCHAVCSKCEAPGPVYDHLPERRFQYVPLWGIPVFFLYALRRVDCAWCGVTVESVPWALGKSPLTRTLALFLAGWAKVLSWQDVARRFGVNWHQVYHAVAWVVDWGLVFRDLSEVTALGIDEVHFGKGQSYLTVVYQLCGPVRRLLYVAPGREAASLAPFFEAMGNRWCGQIQHVCTDMWQAYATVIAERLKNALHILDRFHIVQLLNKAVDEVRRGEARELHKQGIDLLKGLRYVFLKRPENLTESQQDQLGMVLGKGWLKTVRAYLWKEKFQVFWEYTSVFWARRYLKRWCKGAMRSRLQPLKKFVGTIRSHEDLIMNWFEAKKMFSSGAVEGMNRKINLVTRKAYGYKSYEVLRIALFHALGDLPEPEMTHTF